MPASCGVALRSYRGGHSSVAIGRDIRRIFGHRVGSQIRNARFHLADLTNPSFHKPSASTGKGAVGRKAKLDARAPNHRFAREWRPRRLPSTSD